MLRRKLTTRIETKFPATISKTEEYSQGRVQDTINEFKTELPDIERPLINMKPSRVERKAALGYVYKTDALLRKLQSISELGRFAFRNGTIATPKDLAGFLYKINFLTARGQGTREWRNRPKVLRRESIPVGKVR